MWPSTLYHKSLSNELKHVSIAWRYGRLGTKKIEPQQDDHQQPAATAVHPWVLVEELFPRAAYNYFDGVWG
jgi:hypothetical protein